MSDEGARYGFGDYTNTDDFDELPGMGGAGGMGIGGGGEEGMATSMGGAAADPVKAAIFRVNDAHRRFRKAKPEEDRTKAMTVLSKALGEYFDRDMYARQQEIDAINGGLKKMLDGLTKRATAKDAIVDLQLQIIVNEAEGLGFFRTSARPRGEAFFSE